MTQSRLIEIAPDFQTEGVIANFGVIQAMATSAGLQVTPVNVRNSDEIASAVEAFAHSPNGGATLATCTLLD